MQTKKPYFSCVLEKSLSYTLTYIRFSLEIQTISYYYKFYNNYLSYDIITILKYPLSGYFQNIWYMHLCIISIYLPF